MNQYCQLARKAIEYYLENSKILKSYQKLPQEILTQKAGVFVSLHSKKDHALRGCIGTFLPVKENISQEIIANAVSAATDDLRFPPVQSNELKNLLISIDILSKPKLVKSFDQLNPKKYGVIVKAESRCGLLLPDLPEINTKEKQFLIACQKANINPQEPVSIFCFTVKRYKE